MMRKDAYLNEIAQGLKMYDKAYVDEIIGDYEEHFKDGLSEGKSEEEICAELGSAGDVIEEIKDLLGDSHLKTNMPARPDAPLQTSEGKSGGSSGYMYEETKSGSADGDSIFHTLREVYFKAGNADIRLIVSPDDSFNVYTEDSDEMEYIEQTFRNDCFYGSVISDKRGFLGALFGAPVDTVILEIPSSVRDIYIDTVSGDIHADHIHAENLNLTSVSGDIHLKDTQNRTINIDVKSGDMSFKRVSTEFMKIKTLSGDIHYEDVIANEFICNAVSGDIGGRRLESRSAYLKMVSGDVSLKLSCFGEQFLAYTKTVSGDVRVKGGVRVSEQDFQNSGLGDCIKVTVFTVSGDIVIRAEK